MSDKSIENMTDKELRDEVQHLRDDLAKMKRFYEDLFYNLDIENFSSRFVKEQNGMKTKIELTEAGIKTAVSKTDLATKLSEYSTTEQTAEEIKSVVGAESELLGKQISKVSQTAENIRLEVDKKESKTDSEGKYNQLKSMIDLNAEGISTKVSKTEFDSTKKALGEQVSEVKQTASELSVEVSSKESKSDAISKYNDLHALIQINANGIASKVSAGEFASLFAQTADGFTFDGNKTKFSGVIFLTDKYLNLKSSIFYDNSQGPQQILFHSPTAEVIPIVLGDGKKPTDYSTYDTDVFIGQVIPGNEVATRGWVRNNPQPAVFG